MRWITGAALAQGVVITPAEVERELVEVVEQLERGSETIARLSRELGDVSTRYELDYARALHRSQERSADMRKAAALLAVEDTYRAKALLETQLRLARDLQHDLRAQLEAVRSIGASVRSALWGGGGDGSQSGASSSRPPSGGFRP